MWLWRCLMSWRTCCIPCLIWRFFSPMPPCDVGVYMTALCMFWLYPILLSMMGVVIDCAQLSIFLDRVVVGRGLLLWGERLLYVTLASCLVRGHWWYTFWKSWQHLISICSLFFWLPSMLMCTLRCRMPSKLDGLWSISGGGFSRWGSLRVHWQMVGFPFLLYSRLELDQKHFFVLSSPPVVCNMPCQQCMSCWAWERNCSLAVSGCFPKTMLSTNVFILWVTGKVPSGVLLPIDGLLCCMHQSCYLSLWPTSCVGMLLS